MASLANLSAKLAQKTSLKTLVSLNCRPGSLHCGVYDRNMLSILILVFGLCRFRQRYCRLMDLDVLRTEVNSLIIILRQRQHDSNDAINGVNFLFANTPIFSL